jgi:hypothetical protein
VLKKMFGSKRDELSGGWRKLHSEDVTCEVFTAVTMKNVVFWDKKKHFVLHRRHITSPLQSPAS